MLDLVLVQKLAVWAPPVLLAITLHEVAHGWAARALGDDTAARAGRLSLNPFRHIDPIGTVLVPAVLLLVGGFLFGWAKPVPVDARRLHHPKRDMAVVAAAGPAVNALMAIGWAFALDFALHAEPAAWAGWLRYMALAGISINLVLMVLNLLPLPPLDGGRVMVGLLPMRLALPYSRLEPWGLPILLLLMFTGLLSAILYWPLQISEGLLLGLFGIPTATLF
ncbi:MAG TPA: site-2 protease family protein [Nevskiaceae bacterium]|nr:site-2 protease family protein [Nevskiaceae bacterium]